MTLRAPRRTAVAIRPVIVVVLQTLAAIAPAPASAQPSVQGQWSAKFDTQNLMMHATLLPSGKVLFWSRREVGEVLNPPNCTPRIWDPSPGLPGVITETLNKPEYNLFCSGHTLLSDGRVFVAGGVSKRDGEGVPLASVYDPATNMWTQQQGDMSGGRWYPTAVMLPDGGVLVSFGGDENGNPNNTQQIWRDGHFVPTVNFVFPMDVPPYYPRMHVVPDGRVLMTGPLALTQFLDTTSGQWTFLNDSDINLSSRLNNFRDYAPSVLYDVGKILFIGGGNAPTKEAEILDLNDPMRRWKRTDDMNFARRQHNATLLPDGTVLVMGGTQGNGGESNGFNDLTQGQPIHAAELWNPKTGHWTTLAEASVDRCYHSTALLLPDATVLSAGGGEYSPRNDGQQNNPNDSHRDAQIYSPPYLFKGTGDRPVITSAPDNVTYGQTFTVATSHPNEVGQVNWVRLSSVTHSFNDNQRIIFLKFTAATASLSVTAPAPTDINVCPPGHYMMFVLDTAGVPSVAKILRIH